MKDIDKTKKQLINEVKDLQKRIAELEASKTDSNSAEEVLWNRKNKYKTLIENLPQKIFFKDKKSVYVSCNSNYARDLKISPDEIHGKTDYDFYPTELAEKYRADDKRIMKSGSSKTLDETYTQDGKEMVVRTVKTPVRNDKGNIVGILGIFWDITERKRSEELLEASEIKFRTLFEYAGGAMFICNVETGEIMDCNKEAEKLIGHKRDNIIGMYQSELHPQGEEDKYKKKFARHVKKGRVVDYEGEVQHRDGRRIPVLINAKTIKTGHKKMIVGAFLDITDKKKREKEIEENRDFLENIFDTSLDGIYVTDDKGVITMINKSAEKMLGYSKDEFIGKHARELSPEGKEYEEDGMDFLRKLHEEGAVSGRERILLRKKGSLINIEQTAVFLKDEKGNLTGSMSSLRDITERKRAEETLRKSEEKYQNLIEHANDAIVSINQRGEIIEFNEKAEELFGYNREEILGKPSYFLAPQRYRERQKKILKEYGKTGGILGLDKKILEGEGLRKDCQEFSAEFSYFVLELHGETIATAIVRDVTKHKEAEKKFVEYQKQLKSLSSQMTLNEEKERKRLADYLHDQIGQELFAIKIKLELLKDSLSSNEEVKILSDLSNSLIHTIDNTRSLTFELSPPILYQFGLEAALEWLAEHTYAQYNIVVSFEDDKQEKPLGDDVKIFLYQAVRELLTNVAKHAQAKNARVSVKKDNTHIRICVEDNGVGFIPSSKHSSKGKNKGFGLFSIKERLDQFGGHLEIKSRDGRGTQASLTAPLKNKRKS